MVGILDRLSYTITSLVIQFALRELKLNNELDIEDTYLELGVGKYHSEFQYN